MGDTNQQVGNGGGTTTAPVYLRLQKRAQAESRPRPKRETARLRAASLVFLVLLCICCLVWLAAQFVEADPHFQLHAIELRGGRFVSRAQVEDVFAADRNASIYQIPLEQRRHDLEHIPWVRKAIVNRILPDRVSISVEERTPVAFAWTRRGIVLMDADGIILDTPPNASWAFPVVRGLPERESVEKRRARMQRYLTLMQELRQGRAGHPEQISEVDLTDPRDTCVVVSDASGALKLHLGDEKFSARYATYQSHINEWRQQFAEIQSIDLRYEGQVIIQSGIPVTLRLGQESKPFPVPASQAALPKQTEPVSAAASARKAL